MIRFSRNFVNIRNRFQKTKYPGVSNIKGLIRGFYIRDFLIFHCSQLDTLDA